MGIEVSFAGVGSEKIMGSCVQAMEFSLEFRQWGLLKSKKQHRNMTQMAVVQREKDQCEKTQEVLQGIERKIMESREI